MSRYIDADLLMQKWLFRGKSQAMYRDEIRSVPTADVSPVVYGKWEECEIVQEDGDYKIIEEWQSARCSVCGKYHTTPYMYHFDHFNYCPNCGAKMERREDGNHN